MFPFADIQREYTFQSEKWVFDKLNELTYNKFWKVMEGDFVEVEPPTFELWYTGDMQYSGKPLATKLTVTLHRFTGGVHVKATASANKTFYIVSVIVMIVLTIQLFNSFKLSGILVHILILAGLVIWDCWAKVSAFKRLERILS
jgi:hypothetical protein